MGDPAVCDARRGLESPPARRRSASGRMPVRQYSHPGVSGHSRCVTTGSCPSVLLPDARLYCSARVVFTPPGRGARGMRQGARGMDVSQPFRDGSVGVASPPRSHSRACGLVTARTRLPRSSKTSWEWRPRHDSIPESLEAIGAGTRRPPDFPDSGIKLRGYGGGLSSGRTPSVSPP